MNYYPPSVYFDASENKTPVGTIGIMVNRHYPCNVNDIILSNPYVATRRNHSPGGTTVSQAVV